MTRKLTGSCLAIVCLVGGVLAIGPFFKSGDTPDLQDMLNAPKTAMQMHLYSAKRDPKTGASANGMSLGYDYKSADGKRTVRSRNEYENGATENVYYREDESKAWSEDFYPLRPGDTSAVRRSLARFAGDGKTYVSHDVKREDGSWERQGKLLADGNYRQTYFCADGKTPEKEQLFDKDKRFLSETAIFCRTGKPVRATAPGEYDSKLLTLFNADGSVKAKIKAENGYEIGMFYVGDVYSAGGELLVHFNTGGEGGNVELYALPGRVEKEWLELLMSGKTELNIYDTAAPAPVDAKTGLAVDPKRKLFVQTWKHKEFYQPGKGMILQKITEYGADAKVRREIEMNDAGTLPARIILPAGQAGRQIVYTLDAAGTKIIRAHLHEPGKKSDLDQALPADTSVKIPASELKSYDRPDLPEWDDGATNTGNRLYDFH